MCSCLRASLFVVLLLSLFVYHDVVFQVSGVVWEKLPLTNIVKSSKEGFAGIKAFVELKTSKHVVEVEVRKEHGAANGPTYARQSPGGINSTTCRHRA